MKILVDADACPVKDIILEISQKYNIEAIFVCSLSHYSNYYEKHGLNPVYVDNVSQSADLAIINRRGYSSNRGLWTCCNNIVKGSICRFF